MSVKDLEQSSLLQSSYLVGNLLVLVGCCGSSFYNVYCKGLLARFSEVEILIFSYITASLASLPHCLSGSSRSTWQSFAALDLPGWVAFGFLAVFMYGASMLLFFYVLEHIRSPSPPPRSTWCRCSACCSPLPSWARSCNHWQSWARRSC